tara:strand:- start:414 stop:905 length:492 start_codon:yes stop_codon:yes gene_type:complete
MIMDQPQFLKSKVDVSKITWIDVFDKIESDREEKTLRIALPIENPDWNVMTLKEIILHHGDMNTIACHGDYIPLNMIPLFNYMEKYYGMKRFHQYTSFNNESNTLGYHNDTVNVIIVPIIGEMGYRVDGLGEIKMKPGDILYIPKYTFHEPLLYEPRATLSFS